MKNYDLKTKKTLGWVITILLLILLGILFWRGLGGKSLRNNIDDSLVDIANSSDYVKYEGKVNANFEGSHDLDFSFLHKNDIKVTQGTAAQSKWFMLTDASSTNNVTLYFTYEGGRGYSVDDYIKEVLNTNKDIKIEEVKFADNNSSVVKYVFDESSNTEYYIEAIKALDGEPWLAIVENTKANDDVSKQIAKDLMRSLTIK